jgi:hypothetical protein
MGAHLWIGCGTEPFRSDPLAFPSRYPVRPCACLGANRNPEFSCIASHFMPFCVALVTRIGIDNLLITMQKISSRGEIVHIGAITTTE